jgi:hypothetical protein
MTLPAFVFGILLSTFYGVLFHLFRGGGIGRFFLYIILAWIGFWSGHIIANLTGFSIFNVGPLHLGLATLFSWVVMGIGYWLSLVEVDRNKKNI